MIDSPDKIKIFPQMSVPYLKDVDYTYAAISFYGKGYKAEYPDNAYDVLYINADDLDGGKLGDKYRAQDSQYRIMDENDAKNIVEFANRVKDKVDVLICQCKAGQSRSAGCAAAISKHWFNDDFKIFNEKNPNMWIYRLILNAFHKYD